MKEKNFNPGKSSPPDEQDTTESSGERLRNAIYSRFILNDQQRYNEVIELNITIFVSFY